MEPANVRGLWTFITGANRGLGMLAARFMAARGSNLILHARKKENLEPLLRELKAFNVKVETVAAELSDPESVSAMLSEIDSLGHEVSIVLNNAGVQVAYRQAFFETPASDFERSFAVNTIAPAMVCYHFLPKMLGRGFGRIVNTTSGIENEPEQAGYSASKAALDKFTRDLAFKTRGGGVSLNLVDPGWCSTGMGGELAPNKPESAIPGIVLPAFLEAGVTGRLFRAQAYAGLSLEAAVQKFGEISV